MRVGLLLLFIVSSRATVGFLSAFSLDPDGYAGADSEAPYDPEDLFLPEISDDYQNYDPTTLMTPVGPDVGLLPEISQGHLAIGAGPYPTQY